jgi:predicted glycoside hydrolase/deacetylase ChbG (UPF0249 family)
MIIINADDWGRSVEATDAALTCYEQGPITSVTAMVFMADSERAADIALKKEIPTGLHINFTQSFSGELVDERLRDYHERIKRFLKSNRYSQLLYNPSLQEAFRYVFRAQAEEFIRLYQKAPSHFDGHEHMHLCANMLVMMLIPAGQKVRRSFSFRPEDKNIVNRGYRKLVNRRLCTRYHLTDYFFALSQQSSEDGFARVCNLGLKASVELMTHPAIPCEKAFLKSEQCGKALQGVAKGSYLDL